MNNANKNKAKNKLNYISGMVIRIFLGRGRGGERVPSELSLLYRTRYVLHEEFDTQDQEVGQAPVQPLQEVPQLGQGAASLLLGLRSAVLQPSCLPMGVPVGAALGARPGGPGGRVVPGVPRAGAQLDAHVAGAGVAGALCGQPGRGGAIAAALGAVQVGALGLHGGLCSWSFFWFVSPRAGYKRERFKKEINNSAK